MKLGIDLDGVCADFTGAWIHHYERWFDTTVPDDARYVWNGQLDPYTHFTAEAAFWSWVDAVPEFWTGMEPIPGALGALYDLKYDGHELHAITSRHSKVKQDTVTWLKRHGFWAMFEDVHHRPSSQKSEIGCDLYVDDSPKVLWAFHDQGIKAVRFHQEWNVGTPAWSSAKDWRDVQILVRSFGGES